MSYCRECLHDEVCSLTHCGQSIACCNFVNAERLNELMQAEREGRLFTLHCKIGDTVYIPDVEKGIVAPVRVQGISITVSGRVLLHFGGYPAECAWDYDCGKGWYKTSEAAEKALEEAK